MTFLKEKNKFGKKKKNALFLNIRNTQLNQSSQIQPNHEKKILQKSPKIWKNTFFPEKIENFENILFAKKNSIFLVLPIEEISLRPELSSPGPFRFQGG